MGGKQKDRQEMQRLKSASRMWVQSVNLRDPLRRVGGDYGLKKKKNKKPRRGNTLLSPPPPHTKLDNNSGKQKQ